MRALTVLQPWAEMIARSIKRVENRTWKTNYRGPLAIHVGKSRKWMESEDAGGWPERYGVEMPRADELTFGAFVAVAELVDCVPIDQLPVDLEDHPFAAGPWCWILRHARRVGPIDWPGAQRLWTAPAVATPKLLASP